MGNINNYKIEFDTDAYDRHGQKINFSGKKANYSKQIQRMEKEVESLDRYDDFQNLKIPVEKYENTDKGIYGIERTSNHEASGVIYSHQLSAATRFLRDLRGFGLLADVVGSGKTFEAGVILSELAVRNKLRSILFVVPTQVYSDWIEVIEQKFGLGKGVLYEATDKLDYKKINIENTDGFAIPRRPIIVKVEDFANWDLEYTKLLFDAIVVDEAHHLCEENGVFSHAMKMLSMMIAVKKKAKSTYCLLLSATPHSGNLENMYRLWYFIRCTGGNPKDFEENCAVHTDEYLKEKEYYSNIICHNSKTVMEFVQNVKRSEVEINYEQEFLSFLKKRYGIDKETYDSFLNGKKKQLVQEFVDDNYEVHDVVTRNIAKAYHNSVLRTIMIRQSKANLVPKKKNVVNFLFFPVSKELGEMKIEGINNDYITVDVANLYGPNAVLSDGEHMSIKKYIDDNRGSATYNQKFSQLVLTNIIKNIENIDDDKCESKFFVKKGSLKYYSVQIHRALDKADTQVIPFTCNADTDRFMIKYNKFLEIAENNPDKQILVFFDYSNKRKDKVCARFVQEITSSIYKDRVILGNANNKISALEKFSKKDNGILVVTDDAFTEGVNLQTCSIIVNFQVTHDPLSMDQRIGRIFRLGQRNDVTIYSLADMDALEGYALMYFNRIGLMSSNSGDATIIAGSNSESMVTLRCENCKKAILLSREEYEERLNSNDLYCDSEECQHASKDGGPLVLKEICTYDFKCDTCGTFFARSQDKEGYTCVSSNDQGVGQGFLCNKGALLDRNYYCRKICAMNHCSLFTEGSLEGKCAAINAYREFPNITDNELLKICAMCPLGRSGKCPEKCRFRTSEDAILGCSTCRNSLCTPKPHVLRFNDKWEADCPVCHEDHKHGTLKPVVARTFAAYLVSLWEFNRDNGRAFVEELLKEASKVEEIKRILDLDQEEK